MIQRVQSLYLLLSVTAGVLCLCLPLGRFVWQGEPGAVLTNLSVSAGECSSHAPWALFAILLIATVLAFLAIFLFAKRALQMRLASLSMVLLVGWVGYLAVFAMAGGVEGTYRPSWSAGLPLVALVLNWLAFRAIWHDEQLIRSLDRIR